MNTGLTHAHTRAHRHTDTRTDVHKVDMTGGWDGGMNQMGEGRVRLELKLAVWTFYSPLIHLFNRPSINSATFPNVRLFPIIVFFKYKIDEVRLQISITQKSMKLAQTYEVIFQTQFFPFDCSGT